MIAGTAGGRIGLGYAADSKKGVEVVYSGQRCGALGLHKSTQQIDSTMAKALRVDPGADDRVLVAISLGTKPTAGYELTLVSWRAGDVPQIIVRQASPDPDAIVAQVLTVPCLVLRLPGKWADERKRVRVVTVQGVELGTVALARPFTAVRRRSEELGR